MANFADRLQEAILIKNNPTVMGLDPQLENIPSSVCDAFDSEDKDAYITDVLFRFNSMLIDSVADIVPAVKPQFAYYEQYGIAGLKALEKTIAYAKQAGLLVIGDAKRNDIGSTAEAYARAYLSSMWGGLDALTVNGYLGTDGILPFVEACQEQDKGIFVLVRTSNPSAGDIQDLILKDVEIPVYLKMAQWVNQWGETLIGKHNLSSIGAVVGATWPSQAQAIRKVMPHAFILVPGYGAQGGKAIDCVPHFNEKGQGAIVNASRSLMYAYKKSTDASENFQKATRDEAINMQKAFIDVLSK